MELMSGDLPVSNGKGRQNSLTHTKIWVYIAGLVPYPAPTTQKAREGLVKGSHVLVLVPTQHIVRSNQIAGS